MDVAQALASQQGADRARVGGLVGLLDDAQLVPGGELATMGFGHDFGIGSRRDRGWHRLISPPPEGQ